MDILFASNNPNLNSMYITILLIEILNEVLYWKICTFCVVLISFYNKMTIKPQNDAIYGKNNSIFFFPVEWASCPVAGARRFLGGQNTFCPADSDCLAQSLRNYFLESNAELFFVLGVAQNIRVNSHSGMGQNAHRSILPIKHYRRLALQGCQ